jgi:hypothetical protein
MSIISAVAVSAVAIATIATIPVAVAVEVVAILESRGIHEDFIDIIFFRFIEYH